jgi:hypothetical protein
MTSGSSVSFGNTTEQRNGSFANQIAFLARALQLEVPEGWR